MAPGDFPLGRKLNQMGNGWSVQVQQALAATLGAMLILPSATQGFVVTGLMIDASVAMTAVIGSATAVATSVTLPPNNMNLGFTPTPTFTATFGTGAVTGQSNYAIIDVPAAQAYPPIYMSDNPFIVPAGSTTGFLLRANTLTGTVRFTVYLQEFPF